MPVQIPLVPSVARYTVGTALDGVQFLFDVRWNGRSSKWYMDILTEDRVTLLSGIAIVLGTTLGNRSTDPRMPVGPLMVRDKTDNGEDAGFEDMGERVVVYYFSLSELE